MAPTKNKNSVFKTFIDAYEAKKIAKYVCGFDDKNGKYHSNFRGVFKIQECAKLFVQAENVWGTHSKDALNDGSSAMYGVVSAALESLITQILIECAYTIEDVDKLGLAEKGGETK